MSSLKQLKQMVSLKQVLYYYGLTSQLKPKPGGYVGCCPLHQGDNQRAFHINEQGKWYCFSRCQTGGDLIELIRRLEGGGYDSVFKVLRTLTTTEMTKQDRTAEQGTTKQKQIPPDHRQVFVPFTTSLPLIQQHPHFTKLGLKRKTLAIFETGYWPGQGFLKKCLAVRLHDPKGNPMTYLGRRLSPEEINKWGKWKMPSLLPKHSLLFNYHRARRYAQNTMIIVEGPWDVMKLYQAGYQNVIALLGTTLSNRQQALLSDIPHLSLMLDGDNAGIKATNKLIEVLGNQRTNWVSVPAGSDPAMMAEHELRYLLSGTNFYNGGDL